MSCFANFEPFSNGIVLYLTMPFEPRHEKTGFLPMQKQKALLSCAEIAQLISAFVIAT